MGIKRVGRAVAIVFAVLLMVMGSHGPTMELAAQEAATERAVAPTSGVLTEKPQTGQIAYIASDGCLSVAKPDGTNATSPSACPADSRRPTWSNSNQRIAFSADAQGERCLLTVEIESGEVRELACGFAWIAFPAWSPQDTRIAFMGKRNSGSSPQIWAVDADGTGDAPVELASGRVNKPRPVWLDEHAIVFPCGSRMCRVQLETPAAVVPITDEQPCKGIGLSCAADRVFYPDVSADGERIAFLGGDIRSWGIWTDAYLKLYVVDAGGHNLATPTVLSEYHYLLNGGGRFFPGAVKWDAAGERIAAFAGSSDDPVKLHIVDTVGGAHSEALAHPDADLQVLDWAPNSRFIMMGYAPFTSQAAIHAVDASNFDVTDILLHGSQPDWSNTAAAPPTNQSDVLLHDLEWQPEPALCGRSALVLHLAPGMAGHYDGGQGPYRVEVVLREGSNGRPYKLFFDSATPNGAQRMTPQQLPSLHQGEHTTVRIRDIGFGTGSRGGTVTATIFPPVGTDAVSGNNTREQPLAVSGPPLEQCTSAVMTVASLMSGDWFRAVAAGASGITGIFAEEIATSVGLDALFGICHCGGVAGAAFDSSCVADRLASLLEYVAQASVIDLVAGWAGYVLDAILDIPRDLVECITELRYLLERIVGSVGARKIAPLSAAIVDGSADLHIEPAIASEPCSGYPRPYPPPFDPNADARVVKRGDYTVVLQETSGWRRLEVLGRAQGSTRLSIVLPTDKGAVAVRYPPIAMTDATRGWVDLAGPGFVLQIDRDGDGTVDREVDPAELEQFGPPADRRLFLPIAGRSRSTSSTRQSRPVTPTYYRIYTNDADFDKGILVRVVHSPSGQLRLNNTAEMYPYIWVPASGRGTIVKIDTVTGLVLGEYLSAPASRGHNPSRTTVDGYGNVWSGNREEKDGGRGSVVHIGLLENNQCVDRDGDGVIRTSTGLGDILPWPNETSKPSDECILHFVRTNGPVIRHVSADPNSDAVWVGGYPDKPSHFDRLNSKSGAIEESFSSQQDGCGGYGGLVDNSGVLWSAGPHQSQVLRYETNSGDTQCLSVSSPYSLARDSAERIWITQYKLNTVAALSPQGTELGSFSVGGVYPRGVAVTEDDHVWVANSESNTVTRLSRTAELTPTIAATIPVGAKPIGLSVDANGKVWVTNRDSNDVRRIDPLSNSVDLTVALGPGARPYGYSDMTGSTISTPPGTGTWTVVDDSGYADTEWGFVTWHSLEPGDSAITVAAASSSDRITWSPMQHVTKGRDISVPDGRYLKILVAFRRATNGRSPILQDLTIAATPTCICREIRRRVPDPEGLIAIARYDPSRFYGWLLRSDEGKPHSPGNSLRTCLTLQNPNVPYHPLVNSPVWKAGCP